MPWTQIPGLPKELRKKMIDKFDIEAESVEIETEEIDSEDEETDDSTDLVEDEEAEPKENQE